MNGQRTIEILSPWQREREALLQRACERVKERLERGEKLLRSVRIVAQCFNGRAFTSDPARKLKLRPKTLLRWFYAWRANGQSSTAFRIKYTVRYSLFRNLVMAKFADFLMCHPRRSFESNWNIFSSRRSNFRGRWRPAKRAVKAALTKAAALEAKIQAV